MTVLEKCREYCKRMSTSEAHYQFLLSKVCINPQVRNQECSRPDCLCETCDKNKFMLAYFNKMWEWESKHETLDR